PRGRAHPPLDTGRLMTGHLPPKRTAFTKAGSWPFFNRIGRVGMWRGGFRFGLAGAAPFVWRCLNSRTMTPFPHPSHRTGRADFPHPALGQDLTPTPTAGHAPSDKDERDPWSRRHTRVDNPRSRVVLPCACCAATGSTAPSYSCQLLGTPC